MSLFLVSLWRIKYINNDCSPLAEGLFHKAINQVCFILLPKYSESISELSKNIFAEDIKYLTDSNEIVSYLQGLTQTEVYEKYIATAEKYVYPIHQSLYEME